MIFPVILPLPFSRTKYLPTSDRATVSVGRLKYLFERILSAIPVGSSPYQPRTYAKINGATIVASDSMMNFGVSTPNFPRAGPALFEGPDSAWGPHRWGNRRQSPLRFGRIRMNVRAPPSNTIRLSA